jgi:hypothetical protein
VHSPRQLGRRARERPRQRREYRDHFLTLLASLR